MKKHPIRKQFAILISMVLAISLTVPAAVPVSAEATQTAAAEEIDLTEATGFSFSDSGIEVTEGAYTGYKIDGTSLSIKESGVYVMSGSCANGTIVVKKNVTGVTLVLDGLTLSASATAPITCNKGSEVSIVAKAGTVSSLADDEYNNDDIYTDEELYPDIENAVIKGKDGSNVTICGTGTIRITSNGKNGVKGGADLYEEDEEGNATDTLLSTASLTVKDVTLEITANVNDGLKADKELNLLSGTITVTAADDGIKCDYVMNLGAEGTDGPTILVANAKEGIEAATLNVYSGHITVNATDDGINAANSDLTNYSFRYNQYGGFVSVNVTNGDGIDSNGSVNLAGGTMEVYAPSQGDGDPIDTEMGCTFSGATVLAVGHAMMQQSYTGAYVAFGGSGGFGGMGGGSNLVAAGSTITITDASGNTVYTAQSQTPRNASYVVFASPALTSGGSYTLNGSTSATAGTSNGGGNTGPGGQGGFPGQGGIPGQGGEGTASGFGNLLAWLRDLINRIVLFLQSVFQNKQ